MGTAYFYDSYASEYNHDLTIAKGLSNIRFNPGGDPAGSEVEEVRFRFHIDHNGGKKFDLGDVDIWIVSPDGEKNRIYYNFDGFGDDTDDGNDSDGADDHDIHFYGTDLKSSIKFGLDGNPVQGNWYLRIDNQTGITLDLNYLEVWVDYNTAADLEVKDIKLKGVGGYEVGTPMLIETWIENTGDIAYGEKVEIEYLVNGSVIGTSELTFGLGGNKVNYETELYTFDQYGDNNVTVRIAGADDIDTSNNSRTEIFHFGRPDLVVSDVRVLGDWGAGEEIEINAFIENIGTDVWNLLGEGSIKVEYTVNGAVVGSDSLSWGLTPLAGDWEDFTYTLDSDGPVDIGVRVYGDDTEISTANNSWSEQFGNDHDVAGNQKTLDNSAFEVEMASFLVHTIYGQDALPDAFRETNGSGDFPENNGINDDYRGYLADHGWTVLDQGDLGQMFRPLNDKGYFTSDGLFMGDANDINIFSSWAAQGLLAVGTSPNGQKTLTLTFRGTDEDDGLDAGLGQSWTGDGIYNYYEAMRPLIDAALAYANTSSNGIDKLIVSGHSLGGATADLFTLVDAHRLDESVDLTVVSIASAGLDPNALKDSAFWQGMKDQYDDSLVSFDADGNMTLTAPSYYIGLSFSNDTVTFSDENPTSLPLIPNFVLNGNENLDNGLVSINLPHIAPDDEVAEGESENGFGAEHDHGLYWAMLGLLAKDGLVQDFDNHDIMMGETDYTAVKTLGGDPLGVFAKFGDVKDAGYEHDQGTKALQGDGGADYILGLSGDDAISGKGGNDLLSGGTGDDTLNGGTGGDMMDGGEGHDIADYSGATGMVRIDLGDLSRNQGDAAGDSFAGIEEWHGTTHDDVLWGDNAANILSSGAGDDDMRGRGGRDRLEGGDGNDSLNGGKGRDRLEGGLGDDSLFGNNGNDNMRSGKGHDTLDGGAGKDILVAGKSNDVLIGGAGNDTLSGGTGADIFVFADGHGNDVVQDFDALSALEKIDLSAVGAFTDVTDLTGPGGAAAQSGADVLIDTGAGNSILLVNTVLADLDATDFIFQA